MAAPGKLSVECSGESDLSFMATNLGTFASPTFSSLPATHTGSSKSRLHVGSDGLSQSRLYIDNHHFCQVRNSDPTNSLPSVVVKVEVNGDDIKNVNVDRDREDVAIKLQVCDPSKRTSDPDDASKPVCNISMATVIKLIVVYQIIFTAAICSVSMLVRNVNIHSNNVYNYDKTPSPLPTIKMAPALINRTGDDDQRSDATVPVNKMEPALVNSTGTDNYGSDEASSHDKMEPALDSITGDDNQNSDLAVPDNQMEPLLDSITGYDNYGSDEASSGNKMEPALDSITGDDNQNLDLALPDNKMEPLLVNSTGDGNYRSDEDVSEGSTPLRRPDKKIVSKKCMIQGEQIMPQPGFMDYLNLLFSVELPQCSFQSNRIYLEMTSRLGENQKQFLQSDHEDPCFWESSRTQASVRFAKSWLEYSCPNNREEQDIKQLQKEQKTSTMTKDFTALAMQGDNSSKQEAKSVGGTGHDNLTQGPGNMECLISPPLQVLAITVSLFIATFAYARTLLQLLFAVTRRLNSFFDNGRQCLCSGRTLISSACIKFMCHVMYMLLRNRVPPYFGIVLLTCMECSGSGYGDGPDSFDSGASVTGGGLHVLSSQRRQRQGEDVKPADYRPEALSVPKNIQDASMPIDGAPENADPDESYAHNHFDDTDQNERSDDPSDKTEHDCLSLNEVNNVEDFARGIIGESDCQPSIAPDSRLARSGLKNNEDPSAFPKDHDNEVQKGIPSLPEDADIICWRKLPEKTQIHSVGRYVFDDSLETDALNNETSHVSRHLDSQNGSRCMRAILDSVKRLERDFEQPRLPNKVQRDERLHMPPKRKYIWPHWHCIHGEMYDMMNFILGIESALDGTGVFIQVSPLHVLNGEIQSWMVKSLSDSRTAYFDHVGEAPYIEEKVEIETFLQIRRKYEMYISHQDDDPDTLKIYGLKKSVEDDRHFVKIFYQCREAVGYINVFLTFQTSRRRRLTQVHRVRRGQTLKAVMAHPALHNFVSQLKQVYTMLHDGCYMRLTFRGRHVYPSPSWRLNHNCIMEIVPSIKGCVLPSAPHSTERCVEGRDEPA